MHIVWYAILGLFFAGYLVLAGYDYGVGLLLARRGDTAARLDAVGPFFLGNEVWLVAFVGVLFGAFPTLEGELLSGLYPAVAAALAGAITVTVAVQLRGRAGTTRGHHRWRQLAIVGSVLAAGGWGAVLGGLLQGLPLTADGHVTGAGHLATPFVAGCALTVLALSAAHGATFLALRLPPGPAAGHAALGRRLTVVALAAGAASAVVGLLTASVRDTVRPVPAVGVLVLLAAALLAARAALTRRRPGVALAATAVAIAAPVLLVGLATWPYALSSSGDPTAGLTVAQAAAAPATLRLLNVLALPVLPALLGFQAMCWWAFRGRLDRRAPRFY